MQTDFFKGLGFIYYVPSFATGSERRYGKISKGTIVLKESWIRNNTGKSF